MIQIGGVYLLLSSTRRAFSCKSIAIEMGGASRYFAEVSESGVDLTLLIFRVPLSIKGSISWVAKFKGDKNSECKLSTEWSRHLGLASERGLRRR